MTQFTTNQFIYLCRGLSNDMRTNVWRVTCLSCKHIHSPTTTMLSQQSIECPKCGKIELVDYNNETGTSKNLPTGD